VSAARGGGSSLIVRPMIPSRFLELNSAAQRSDLSARAHSSRSGTCRQRISVADDEREPVAIHRYGRCSPAVPEPGGDACEGKTVEQRRSATRKCLLPELVEDRSGFYREVTTWHGGVNLLLPAQIAPHITAVLLEQRRGLVLGVSLEKKE